MFLLITLSSVRSFPIIVILFIYFFSASFILKVTSILLELSTLSTSGKVSVKGNPCLLTKSDIILIVFSILPAL